MPDDDVVIDESVDDTETMTPEELREQLKHERQRVKDLDKLRGEQGRRIGEVEELLVKTISKEDAVTPATPSEDPEVRALAEIEYADMREREYTRLLEDGRFSEEEIAEKMQKSDARRQDLAWAKARATAAIADKKGAQHATERTAMLTQAATKQVITEHVDELLEQYDVEGVTRAQIIEAVSSMNVNWAAMPPKEQFKLVKGVAGAEAESLKKKPREADEVVPVPKNGRATAQTPPKKISQAEITAVAADLKRRYNYTDEQAVKAAEMKIKLQKERA